MTGGGPWIATGFPLGENVTLLAAGFTYASAACALLPLVEREPLFHLCGEPDPDPQIPLPGGYPVLATFGEQGPAVSGWLARFQPEIAAALHLLEGLIRRPQGLAAVLSAAGPAALEQVGRCLVVRSTD